LEKLGDMEVPEWVSVGYWRWERRTYPYGGVEHAIPSYKCPLFPQADVDVVVRQLERRIGE
jgi:hypothetical protein